MDYIGNQRLYDVIRSLVEDWIKEDYIPIKTQQYKKYLLTYNPSENIVESIAKKSALSFQISL